MAGKRSISNSFTVITVEDAVSVAAQYTASVNSQGQATSAIHDTWQDGDKYMRTKATDETNWSPWSKVVGENGGETDYMFALSANTTSSDGTASTSPSDISSDDWQDAPMAVTTQKPYLWSRVQKKVWSDQNGTYVVSSTRYIRLTGEEGDDGVSPVFADLDNEMDSIVCDNLGKPKSSQTVSTTVGMWQGTTPVGFTMSIYDTNDQGHEYSSGTAYQGVTVTFNSSTGAVSVAFATSTVQPEKRIFLIRLTSSVSSAIDLFFTVNCLRGSAVYNILPSKTEVSVGRTDGGGYNPSSFTMTCGYVKNVGGTMTTVPNANSQIDGKYYLYYRLRLRSTKQWSGSGNYDRYDVGSNYDLLVYNGVNTSLYDMIEFILCENDAYAISESDITGLIDKETVPIIADGAKGAKGDTGDNGEDAIVYIIEPDVLSIKIPSNTSTVELDTDVYFYKRVGTGSRTAYNTYFAAYRRTGNTFTRVTDGQSVSCVVTTDVTASVDAVVIYMFSSSYSGTSPESQSYIVKREIAVIKNGDKGDIGKAGRWYYYGGDFDVNDDEKEFVVNDVQVPFFTYTPQGQTEGHYMYNTPTNGTYTMSDMGTPSNSAPWVKLDDQFPYLITQAVFGKFAKFGSAVINEDWLISAHGKNGTSASTEYQYFSPKALTEPIMKFHDVSYDYERVFIKTYYANRTYRIRVAGSVFQNGVYFNLKVRTRFGNTNLPFLVEGESETVTQLQVKNESGKREYIIVFTPSSTDEYGFYIDKSNSSYTVKMTAELLSGAFIPNYAVDLKTGATYENDAHIKGTIEAVNAKLSGNLYTPYLRLNSSNISQYSHANVFGESCVWLEDTGLNLQVEISSASLYLPRITDDMLGCEVNIFNATTGSIEVNGSGQIGSSAEGAYFCGIVKPSVASSLQSNANITIHKFCEAKFKAIDNGNTSDGYKYSWLCCYVNINP